MDSKLKKLVKGHSAFQKVKFKKNEERFKRLVEQGQNPKALFIGCSDSRVMPDMITGAKPGDLFIIRNIGNFVAPYKPDEDYHSTASAVEYAVSILEVSDIIVCGHSHCGAIEALYTELPRTAENLHTNRWLDLGKEAKRVASLACKDKNRTEMLRYTEKISVVYQLENLLTYPGVQRRIEEGNLFLHAWYYDLESGVIEHYDDEKFEFIPLGQK